MKKLVLVLVCAIMMTIFVAFNYLLWDKEQNTKSIKNLEYKNEDKEATINALGREIKNLEDSNRELSSRIKALETNNSDLQKRYDEIEQEQQKSRELLERKNEIINVFKQQVDMKPIETIIRKWAESIDKGQYEAAYKLELQHFKENGEIISLSEYGEGYKNSIKSMKLKDIKLYNGDGKEIDSGDIVFSVSLEVEKNEDSAEGQFVKGNNEKLFYIIYDKEKGGWIIADIVPIPKAS